MSLFIDQKFIASIAPKLENFTRKNNYLWNFRCPFCGDSKKNKLKSRGYFYRKKSNISYICHNCGTSMSFGNFLKSIDVFIFNEYQMERYKNESASNVSKPDFSIASSKPVFIKKTFDIPTIAELTNHPAKDYVIKRMIPQNYHNHIYFAENFKHFMDQTFPDHDKVFLNEERLIIPFYDTNKNLLGLQGRAIGDSKVKYITYKVSEDSIKIFGADKVDFTKPVYVVEGPIDSMFIPNSVATMDASLYSVETLLGKHDYVLVHDNQPRNFEVVNHIKKSIDKKFKVCVFPDYIKEKDINDMIMSGKSADEIKSMIDENTHQDLQALLKFEIWRKV